MLVSATVPATGHTHVAGVLALSALGAAVLGVKAAEERGYVTVHWGKVQEEAVAGLQPLYAELRKTSLTPHEIRSRLDEVLSTTWNLPGAVGFAEGLIFAVGPRSVKLAAVGSSALLAFGSQDERLKDIATRMLSEAESALSSNRKRP